MRYVDDILLIWEDDDEELKVFFEEVNKLEENIKFKMEVGNKEINFLDLNIRITREIKLKFDIDRKSTYRNVIIPNDLYHPIQYKITVCKTYFYSDLYYTFCR